MIAPIVYFDKLKKFKVFVRDLASFFVPKKANYPAKIDSFDQLRSAVIIATYKPSHKTKTLVENITKWHKNTEVIIVDDTGPDLTPRYKKMLKKLKSISRRKRVHFVKNTEKTNVSTKANPVNFGIKYIKQNPEFKDIKIIFTPDDDTIITSKTLPELGNKLYSNRNYGAVTGNTGVINKEKNLLTRLQGLEYHGFNMTRTTENGFVRGPLIVQGMLSAYKMSAIRKVKKFSESNLIEDYEMTANLKKNGYSVAFAPKSWARTDVPEDLSTLWKQRVRWSYWGIEVIHDYRKVFTAYVQDFLAHFMFISLSLLILLSFLIPSVTPVNNRLIAALLGISFIHFSISYLFGIYTLKYYKGVDWKDRLLRLLIIPEFIYSNIQAMVLVGSYFYYIFNHTSKTLRLPLFLHKKGMSVFEMFGFTRSWNTRTEEGGAAYE